MSRHQWGEGHNLPGWKPVRPYERQACTNDGCQLVRVPSPARQTDYYPRAGGSRMTERPPCPFVVQDERKEPCDCEGNPEGQPHTKGDHEQTSAPEGGKA